MDPELPTPRTIGRYALERLLGSGGMGEVWGATMLGRNGFRKPVAVKIISSRRHNDALLQEARVGARLHHPNLVETYDVAVVEGQALLAMEWVRGPTLAAVLEGGALPGATAVEIARQLAVGLGHLHAAGDPPLAHRDLKPTNVLLDPIGLAKIADFGLAAAVSRREEAVHGTLGYIAPETLLEGTADARSDVFALGTVLAEMLLGWPVWPRGLSYQTRILQDPVDYLRSRSLLAACEAARSGVAAVLERCLGAAPGDRFADGTAVAAVLEGLQAPRPQVVATLAASRHADHAATPVAAVTRSTRQRTNLGRAPDRFVGREALREAVLAALGRARIVTLVGPGGAGKSRLARTVARDLLDDFDEVWAVDLAGTDEADGLVAAVASRAHIAVDDPDPDGLIDGIGAALSARGAVLLLLDNFEQLVAHRGVLSRWVEPSGCTLLVTSQRRLRIRGEQVVEVAGMAPDEAAELYRERAAAAGTPRAMDDAAVQQLVEAVDGLPLAVELAAASARMLDPDALAGLDMRALTDRGGDRPPRHRSLSALIGWSWSLLEPWQQAALAQLSVFRGGFTVEQAEAVLELAPWPEAPWALFVVEDLLDRSLLSVVDPAGPRFGMLGSVVGFASHQLADDPAAKAATEQRHGRLFAELGTPEQVKGRYTADRDVQLRALQVEQENLAVAVDRACRRDDGPVAVDAGRALIDIMEPLGQRLAALAIARRVLALPSVTGEGRMRMLLQAAVHASSCGDEDAARLDALEGMALSNELGRPDYHGIFALERSDLEMVAGRTRAGMAWGERALEALRQAGDHINTGIALERVGSALATLGQFTRASEVQREANAFHRRSGHATGLANGLRNLADHALWRGDLAAALAVEEALAAHLDGAQPLACLSLWGLRTTLYGIQGRWAEAEQAGERTLEIAATSEDARVACNARLIVAAAVRGGGRDVVPLCRQLVPEAVRFRLVASTVGARRVLAEALADASHTEEAWAEIGAALEGVRGVERPVQHAEVLVTRARIAALRGTPVALDEARALLAGTDVGAGSLLGRALAAVEALVAVRVARDGTWFTPPGGEPVDLSRRKPIRQVLVALVRARVATPGQALGVDALLRAGWPDEYVLPDAAGNRVYNAVATLRRSGLRGVIERVEQGYRVDPAVEVVFVERVAGPS